MEKASVFGFFSYKEVLKQVFRPRGSLSRAAEALSCQRSYLSRVTNSELHLTMDQAFALAHHLRFSPLEREYFQVMVEHERAGLREYKSHLQIKLKEIQKRHESLSQRTSRPKPTGEHESIYFSAWYWTAIHFLTSIPEFRTVESISEQLHIPESLASDCLEQLSKWGFVQQSGEKFKYAGGEFHLPKDSPFVVFHHQNWRNRAVVSSQIGDNDDIHYTNVQTISKADFQNLKDMVLKFLGECGELTGPSTPEQGIAVTLDLFKI